MSSTPVLCLMYSFPPVSEPGVFRSLYFARYLPEFGYTPIVIAATPESMPEHFPLDERLASSLPASTEIIHVPSGYPQAFVAAMQRLRIFRLFWFFLFPLFWAPAALWPFKVQKTARRLIRERNIPLIYTTAGPHASLLAGYLLQRATGARWVADIRDPLTDGYMWQWPSKLHWYLGRMMEAFLLRRADLVIVNTPTVRDLYLARNWVAKDRCLVLTNGYES